MGEISKSAFCADIAPRVTEFIVQGSRLGTWAWNIQTGEAHFNEEWANIVGYELSDLEPVSIQTWINMTHPDDLAGSNDALKAHFLGVTDTYSYHVRMRHKDGRWVHVMDKGSLLIRDENGEPLWAFGVHMDVTEQVNQQDRLKLMRKVIETTHQGVMVTDASALIQEVNQAFCNITGYSSTDATGENPSILSSGRHDRQFYQKMWQCITTDDHWKGTIWNRHKSGEVYPQLLTIDALRSPLGDITHYIGTFTDISELMKEQKLLIELASRDSLTNLPNRRTFDQELSRRIYQAELQEQQLLLVFMDLNQFKSLNDTYGHYEGDKFLCKVAKILAPHFESDGLLCRIGGDEFIGAITLTPNFDKSAFVATLKSTIRTICNGYTDLNLGISIGMATFPQDAQDLIQLVAIADERMYTDKHRPTN